MGTQGKEKGILSLLNFKKPIAQGEMGVQDHLAPCCVLYEDDRGQIRMKTADYLLHPFFEHLYNTFIIV